MSTGDVTADVGRYRPTNEMTGGAREVPSGPPTAGWPRLNWPVIKR
jgi:hypothetical protein